MTSLLVDDKKMYRDFFLQHSDTTDEDLAELERSSTGSLLRHNPDKSLAFHMEDIKPNLLPKILLEQ